MKRNFLTLVLLVFASIVMAQDIAIDINSQESTSASETTEDDLVLMVVETMPEYPGGAQEMMRFISTNIQYPRAAQKKGIQGRVICQFVIEKDGRVTNIVVVRSSGDASLDKEAVRVIGCMPRWKPGKQRGKYVRVKYTIPINFRLQ